tara:strand:+ start:1143 stop:1607 length:465 start_codon:yes stop_codon:yes gene_type:complete
MILDIATIGDDVLRKKCLRIDKDYPNLKGLIEDMWETMDKAVGCGLAASQVNHPIQLFLVKGSNFKGVFINAKILKYSDESLINFEGCLSIPNNRRLINRPTTIVVQYDDENFVGHVKAFIGWDARIIQHEFDHTKGVLHIDYPEETENLITKL